MVDPPGHLSLRDRRPIGYRDTWADAAELARQDFVRRD
jgi:hypothetical protein